MPIIDPSPCPRCGRLSHTTDVGINILCPPPRYDDEYYKGFEMEAVDVPEVALNQERPSWDAYFISIAEAVSTRATCPRRAVGAILVKDKRILATGYNGSPAGHAHCTDAGCLMEDGHCVRVIHAEANAVLQSSKYGMATEGATCYCTTLPCLPCAKLLIGAGVTQVRYTSDYRADSLLEHFELDLVKL